MRKEILHVRDAEYGCLLGMKGCADFIHFYVPVERLKQHGTI